MKRLLQLSALIAMTLAGDSSYAQKLHSNSVKLMSAGFYVADRQAMTFPNRQLGVAYERRVFKNLFAGAAYHKWTRISGIAASLEERSDPSYMVSGLCGSMNYKMVDVNVFYKYQLPNKRHNINAGIGASYCWGTDVYWDNPMWDIWGPGCMISYRYYDAAYYGIVPQISYDYNFLRNHLNAGVDLRARYYTGRAPGQYDYGVHLGVNF